MPDVELPQTLEKLPRAYFTTDHDCYDRLTKLLSSRKFSPSDIDYLYFSNLSICHTCFPFSLYCSLRSVSMLLGCVEVMNMIKLVKFSQSCHTVSFYVDSQRTYAEAVHSLCYC